MSRVRYNIDVLRPAIFVCAWRLARISASMFWFSSRVLRLLLCLQLQIISLKSILEPLSSVLKDQEVKTLYNEVK